MSCREAQHQQQHATPSLPATKTIRSNMNNTHKFKNSTKIISVLVAFVFFTINLTGDYQINFSRHLSAAGVVKQDAQIFQMTLTGVPNRVPTLVENMFFEGILSDYLKDKLTPKGLKTYGVRVTRDKTMHYQRALHLEDQREDFTVAGQQFNSNGGLEIDGETLNRINDFNRRVLGSASGGDSTMHQLSLLVNIKGMYSTSLGIDFDSSIMNAVNQGQMELVRRLVNPDKDESEGADYFKDIQFLVVMGVGPRDTEPVLRMSNDNIRGRAGTTARGNPDVSGEVDVSTTSIFDNLGKEDVGSQPQARSNNGQGGADNQNLSQARSNTGQGGSSGYVSASQARSSDEYNPNTKKQQQTYNPFQKSSKSDTKKEMNDNSDGLTKTSMHNLQSHVKNVFNAKAIEFRFVSGIVFIILCGIVFLLHLARVAAKKHEERKRRLLLAKKAYDVEPRKNTNINQPFYKNSRKYTGTMDTGLLV